MRPQLLGYLLDALEPDERDALEQKISSDPALAAEVESLRDQLDPLMDDDEPIEIPAGLAQRTCHFVAARSQIERDTTRPTGSTSQWTMQDIGVAAGIFVAASMLFFPAVMTSRNNARVAHCGQNMATIGTALAQYASFFGGQLPPIDSRGNLATAGVYGSYLADGGFLDQPNALVCPSSSLAENASSFEVPTLEELRSATGDRLIVLRRKVGGSYAYALGYVSGGRYFPPATQNRANFPMLADAPSESGSLSEHHGRNGQNTLFEDGHVQFLKSSMRTLANGQQEDFFLNDNGIQAAGLHPEDAVLAPSATPPLPAVLQASE